MWTNLIERLWNPQGIGIKPDFGNNLFVDLETLSACCQLNDFLTPSAFKNDHY